MANNFYGSICLTDIPKSLITTGRNGKKYLNVVVNERREVGQYGQTHYIKAYARKDAVPPGNEPLYRRTQTERIRKRRIGKAIYK